MRFEYRCLKCRYTCTSSNPDLETCPIPFHVAGNPDWKLICGGELAGPVMDRDDVLAMLNPVGMDEDPGDIMPLLPVNEKKGTDVEGNYLAWCEALDKKWWKEPNLRDWWALHSSLFEWPEYRLFYRRNFGDA